MANKPKQKGYFDPRKMTEAEMREWTVENQELVRDQIHKLLLITGDGRKTMDDFIKGMMTYEYCGSMLGGGYDEFDA